MKRDFVAAERFAIHHNGQKVVAVQRAIRNVATKLQQIALAMQVKLIVRTLFFLVN